MPKTCIIFTNIDNKESAYEIAEELVSTKLVACINISKINSIFYWEDKIQNRKEYKLMIKAKSENYQKIEQKILEMHNDKIPEIIMIDVVQGLDSYLNWINS